VQISIPQKDAIAIEPPKKVNTIATILQSTTLARFHSTLTHSPPQVIKALYDYNAPAGEPSHYLSFSAGDFLHVVSRENDSDWYEACNPLHNSRGLVPVSYFDTVGKTVRDSAESTKSASATHDSGYAEGAHTPARSIGAGRISGPNGAQPDMTMPPMPGHRASKSIGKQGGVYGIVSYDFVAERPDELDAKEGEAIIVIAQSNPEWFVAKPITRLGGPGLIPVSFIEIRDMTTGKAVDDPLAAVQQAGIPRVEEWKKMAAEYKNTSIPLGSVSSSQQQAQGLAQGMDRMSLQSSHHNSQDGYGQQRAQSNYGFQQQQAQNLFAPVRAAVPKYIFADEKFHFVVECKLTNNTHWDLSRIYEDFYELQINLINAFPEEAGSVPGTARTLPYMPGPVKFVTDNITEGRRENLDQYLRELLGMAQRITCSSLVRNFFAPREGDYEVDPNVVDLNEHARSAETQQRYSHASQGSYNQTAQSMHSHTQSRQGSSAGMHQHSQSQASNSPYTHQRGQPSLSANAPPQQQQQGHYRSPSEYTQNPPPANSQPPPRAAAGGNLSTGPVKVKAWFDRETCVVIRMPPRGQFNYADLYQKIVDRRKLEFKDSSAEEAEVELDIEYRDEENGEYYRLEGDEDLEIGVERNEKLTLAVRVAGS
jgi:bud emergence protein 1